MLIKNIKIIAIALLSLVLLAVGAYFLNESSTATPDLSVRHSSATASHPATTEGREPATQGEHIAHPVPPKTAVDGQVQSRLTKTLDLPEQIFTDHHAALIEQYGADEADFRMAVIATVGDWEKTKELIRQREAQTGADYGDLLMRAGLASGGISSEEIIALINRGIAMPEDTFHILTYSAQFDTVASLANQGFFLNVNEPNPATGTNAIGTFVQHAGYFPNRYSAEEATAALEQLIDIGVDPHDGMTYAIDNVNPSNADLKLEMVKALIDQGVPLTEQHRNLVTKMKDGPHKTEFLSLF